MGTAFRASAFTALLITVVGLVPDVAYADKRIALVIGNSSYKSVPKLPNPINDAAAVAGVLKNAGFQTVESRNDIGNVELRRAIRDFAVKARSADVAVVYFAGHGIEVDGSNFLIPVDAMLQQDVDVEDETLSLDRILKALEPVKRLRLVILDACRDNPFAKTMKRSASSRAVGRGLARVEVMMSDTLIAYAAKAGSVALDGEGANSPFTTALVKYIAEPGVDLRLAFGKVRDDVLGATANKQEPFVYGSLGGTTVSLIPPVAAPPIQPTAKPDVNADMNRHYEFAAQIGTVEAWDLFLTTYPRGLPADLARVAREKIVNAEKTAAAAEAAKVRADAAEKAQAANAATERAKANAAKANAEAAERAKQDAAEKARAGAAANVASERAKAEAGKSAAEAAEKAKQEAAKVQVASVTPNAPDPKDVARSLQSELRRVGCYAGTVDGNWNAVSQKSLESFNRYSGMKVTAQTASLDAVDAIKAKTSRICPLSCETGFRAEGERCVAIVCPAGEKLGSDGRCQKPKEKTASRPAQSKEQSDRPAAATGGPRQVVCGPSGCSEVKPGCHAVASPGSDRGGTGGGAHTVTCR